MQLITLQLKTLATWQTTEKSIKIHIKQNLYILATWAVTRCISQFTRQNVYCLKIQCHGHA